MRSARTFVCTGCVFTSMMLCSCRTDRTNVAAAQAGDIVDPSRQFRELWMDADEPARSEITIEPDNLNRATVIVVDVRDRSDAATLRLYDNFGGPYGATEYIEHADWASTYLLSDKHQRPYPFCEPYVAEVRYGIGKPNEPRHFRLERVRAGADVIGAGSTR